ncbi:MAG: biotin--[acetyl-CoA-carboxylase] ligase [Brachymonas sp.]|nr:biotin--[acetyl-CoA-carboxylase] ligase [Brachymonas sp.]
MHWPAENIWQQVMTLGLPSLAAFSVEILPEIDSTNSELMRRARAGRTEPTLLIAERQTAGRGRMGRDWQSSAVDSLTFSLGLNLLPTSWEGLSLAVGTSVAQSLGAGIALKWPNDLWWQSRKLAGILIETASAAPAGGNSTRFAVIGIGINIAARPADSDLRTPAAWLQEISPASSAQSALARLFLPLLTDLLEFERAGFAAFFARFATLDALRDTAVVLSDGQFGVARGVDHTGALLVHTPQSKELRLLRVASQEVSVRPQTTV